jgi:hypothetical protein
VSSCLKYSTSSPNYLTDFVLGVYVKICGMNVTLLHSFQLHNYNPTLQVAEIEVISVLKAAHCANQLVGYTI